MKLLSSIFFCLSLITLRAQESDLDQFFHGTYEPQELNINSSDRLDSIYRSYIAIKNSEDEEGRLKEFVFEYNFFLDQLNKGGEVLYANEISDYLNELKDQILRDSPVKNRIKVYLTNFCELNAFTNDFGSIYMNVGTIAKMGTEDDLIVVLAHEIAHVILEHSYKLENIDLDEKIRESKATEQLELHKFSRAHELEADSLASILLESGGFGNKAFLSSFKHLHKYANPVFEGLVKPEKLFFDDIRSMGYYDRVMTNVVNLNYDYEIDSAYLSEKGMDSLSTHPSIEKRLENLGNLITEELPSTRQNSGKHKKIKQLAVHLYLRKLVQDGHYIEALHLNLKLRETNPENPDLVKMQLKLMLLITQSKYAPYAHKQQVNIYGDACDDIEYLRFRHTIIKMPQLEFNILTCKAIQHTIEHGHPDASYLQRMLKFSNQFLYKNNTYLFEADNGKLVFIPENNHDQRVNDMTLYQTSGQSEYKTNLSKSGFIFVDSVITDSSFVQNYMNDYAHYDELNNHILSYKSQRNNFEETLTLDEFIISFDFEKVYKDYRKGEYVSFNPLPDSARIALVQSDTYVLKQSMTDTVLNIERTVVLDEMIANILEEEHYFDDFITNRPVNGKRISLEENYSHYILNTFIDDCWQLSDLMYSSVDEEVLQIVQEREIDYLAYNINFLVGGTTKKKTNGIFYSMYLDVNNMGVVYISKIASKERPSKNMLRHFFYSSYYGKSF
ncbi:MAG: M48 family metalloprotease [Fluviicola sp.]